MDLGGENGGESVKKLRVFFIPFFASGHMIPMADLAALFSRHTNVEPTICLTAANAAFLRPTLDPSVKLLLYPFPSEDVGLSVGQENLSTVPSEESWKIYKAVDLSQPAHDRLLRDHRPDAVVADIPFWWTTAIARDLGIPRITWHAVGVFPQVVMNSLYNHRNDDASDPVTVPEIPGQPINIPRSELPEFLRSTDHLTEAWGKLKKAQLESYGVVVNTFYEMEPAYCDHYRKTDCKKGWFVGPVALARGGNKAKSAAEAEDRDQCLTWLDGKDEGSVVFVCFGSWCNLKDEQLKEMAVGLEESGQSFLWVVRGSGGWMPEAGWERRVAGRGLVVKGWAPQVAIMEHKAVGAFLTHCGWNSVLEAAAAGVPMLTWPLVFEQFINERLVVEVVGAGERAWDGFRSTREEERVVVPGEVIGRAVTRFMEKGRGGGGGGGGVARECAAKARAAVAEGGSSWNDLNRMIDELTELRDKREKLGRK